MENAYSNSKINIFHALDNMYPEYLPKSLEAKRLAAKNRDGNSKIMTKEE
jgi:hypothetical protein